MIPILIIMPSFVKNIYIIIRKPKSSIQIVILLKPDHVKLYQMTHCKFVLLRPNAVSCVGVLGNIFNIGVLISNRKNTTFTQAFLKLLITLSSFDLLYLIIVIGIFGLPALSPWYTDHIYFKILPTW